MRNPAQVLRRSAAAILLVSAGGASASSVYDEASSGDLSDDQSSPTVLNFSVGANELIGTTGLTPLNGTDRDFARLVVPSGFELTAMILLPGTQPAGGVSFVGISRGDFLATDATSPNPAKLLGWMHFGTGHIGTDLLPELGDTFGSIGFKGPLPSGTYALWVQDNGFEGARYGFSFQIAAVPEPETYVLLGAGLGMIGLMRFRRRNGR